MIILSLGWPLSILVTWLLSRASNCESFPRRVAFWDSLWGTITTSRAIGCTKQGNIAWLNSIVCRKWGKVVPSPIVLIYSRWPPTYHLSLKVLWWPSIWPPRSNPLQCFSKTSGSSLHLRYAWEHVQDLRGLAERSFGMLQVCQKTHLMCVEDIVWLSVIL